MSSTDTKKKGYLEACIDRRTNALACTEVRTDKNSRIASPAFWRANVARNINCPINSFGKIKMLEGRASVSTNVAGLITCDEYDRSQTG